MDKLQQHKDYHRRVLESQLKHLGPDHVNVAHCYHNLGLVCRSLGELDQAKNYHQQALEIKKKQLGPNHVDVANSYHGLGTVHYNVGELDQAKIYHQQALEIRKKQLGPNHVDVANSYHNLGAVYYNLGELDQAKNYHQQALEIRKKQLGPNHVDVGNSYHNLGTVYYYLGELDQAKNYNQKALEIRKKQLGPNHVDVANSYHNLGAVYYNLGELDQAKNYHQQALEIRKKQFDPNHVDVARCHQNLGHVYSNMGELEQARNCYEQAQETQNKKWSSNYNDSQEDVQVMTHDPDAIENKKEEIAASRCDSWKKKSAKHQEKFQQLLEMLEKEPETITRINDNDVCFKEEFVIGRGSCGTEVYICLGSDGIERAIKCLPKSLCQKLLKNERDILNSQNAVESPRVVNYWFSDHNTSSRDFGYLILDLHEQNLEEYVQEKGEEISECYVRKMIRQVLEGLKALHAREPRILHRDLKPTNILVNVNNDLVLSDFGIGRFFPQQGM